MMAEKTNDTKLQKQLQEMDTPDMHETFLRGQWKDFARFAYTHYLKEGRGAVLIDLKHGSLNARGLQLPSYYVGQASERLAKLGGWPNVEIAQAIAEYDPELRS